jgi:hypothetical protein
MKKLMAGALAVTAIAVTSTFSFASSDREEIEAACRQAAMDEEIEMADISDYIADCIAANLAAGETEGIEEQEDTTESMQEESE